ncbi:MAG: UbiD family decarboxylase domain-containing protein [Candidatus Binatia bacterium]
MIAPPQWDEKDGGPYVGTFDAVISHDPDSGYINVGTYRVQVHDQKTVGLWIIPGKHGNLIAQKYWSKGEDYPFLIACGVPPSMMLARSSASNSDRIRRRPVESKHLSENSPQNVFTEFWPF